LRRRPALGYRPQSSSIWQAADGWRGGAVLVAGVVAERIAVNRPWLGSSLDEAAAHDLLCGMVTRKLGGSLDQRIVDWISRTTVYDILKDERAALDRVAAALIEKHVLDAHELQSLLMDVRPRPEELTRQFFVAALETESNPRWATLFDVARRRFHERT
jgi:hypothetical protein